MLEEAMRVGMIVTRGQEDLHEVLVVGEVPVLRCIRADRGWPNLDGTRKHWCQPGDVNDGLLADDLDPAH